MNREACLLLRTLLTEVLLGEFFYFKDQKKRDGREDVCL